MLLLFLSFWMCQLSDSASKGISRDLPTSLKTRWYGPSYQPKGWNTGSLVGLRSELWGYDSDNGKPQKLGIRKMPFCSNNLSFKAGAFEGSMIGLSIGVVLGTVRAIILEGIPHSEDETPCKTLISHVIGGLISGALIGLVYVFFKGCVFK